MKQTNTPKKRQARPEIQKAGTIRREVAQQGQAIVPRPMNALEMTFDKALSTAKVTMVDAMQNLTAAIAMKDLSPAQLAQVHDYTAACVDAIEEAKKLARARVLELCLRQGEPVGDSGKSRELHLPDGRIQRITIQKSGTDPKKFEAALRAKNASVQKYMEQVISYKLSETGVKSSIDDGVFTPDEVDAMAYEETYRVDRTKEGKSDE